ncbi:preprotein translocase subunit YajC [Gleimia hominis]|uniref:Preprotein translocase subunit YajC n=1 Tax=Gleimia hominis TaxID=595468 RepID=A0ABU3IBE5_9ACTO|nr:preprotein translocase subunit YajC [Gleimia hominis]MDT3767699.1 preprotein translocase subunit YajC [Gleimia hominis]
MSIILFAIVAIGVMWFMSSQARKKQAKHIEELQRGLEEGVWVRTGSGYYGIVSDVDGDVVILTSPAGDETYWDKRAIAMIADPPFAADLDAEETDVADADSGAATEADVADADSGAATEADDATEAGADADDVPAAEANDAAVGNKPIPSANPEMPEPPQSPETSETHEAPKGPETLESPETPGTPETPGEQVRAEDLDDAQTRLPNEDEQGK